MIDTQALREQSLISKTSRQIIDGIKGSLYQERHALADGLIFLGEFEARKLYLQEAFPNTFTYLTNHLNLSKSSASKRITSAKALRLFPELYDFIAQGKIHLSGTYLISKHLNKDTDSERARYLIDMAQGKSREAIEMELSRLYPQDVKRTWKRSFDLLPVMSDETKASDNQGRAVSPGNKVDQIKKIGPVPDFSAVLPRERAVPVSSSFVRLAVNLDKDYPSLLKKSFAKPNISKRPYISSRIKNEIYLRDHGQCTYQNKEGIRCRAKTGLHLDHIRPFALGGETALENLRLRCAGHNLRSAMDVFGDDFIRKKIEKNQRK